MDLLKKENWWVWLLLSFVTGGAACVMLGALLDCFDKNKWYANWKNWLIGFVCLIFPVVIMITILIIEITAESAAKLNIPGKELYLSPYVWLLCLIIPFIGWTMLAVLYLYLNIMIIVNLYRGEGEQYI